MLTDTHTHLYHRNFDTDRDQVMERAFGEGVSRLFLPNIDLDSVDPMLALCKRYPENCFPMLGLHPCSVDVNYKEQLRLLSERLNDASWAAIGEIGIDLYWDKSLLKEQQTAFDIQVVWALSHQLPIVIHSRDSFPIICDQLEDMKQPGMKGVFHCFTGSYEEARRALDLGFYLGIGGVSTFKNTQLREVLTKVPLDRILLETDAPYLAPVPYRGKRNESSYLVQVADQLAAVYQCSREEIARQTTDNSRLIFGI